MHINFLYPKISIDRAQKIIQKAVQEKKTKILEKFINSRNDIESKKYRNGGDRPNVGRISTECTSLFNSNNKRYIHGKTVIGILISKLQEEIGENINLFKGTEFIIVDVLNKISTELWAEEGK